jgi:hypothetical protein
VLRPPSCPGRKSFRSHKPIAAIDAIKNLTILANDQTEAAVLGTFRYNQASMRRKTHQESGTSDEGLAREGTAHSQGRFPLSQQDTRNT